MDDRPARGAGSKVRDDRYDGGARPSRPIRRRRQRLIRCALSAGLSQPALERLGQVMTTEQGAHDGGWLGIGPGWRSRRPSRPIDGCDRSAMTGWRRRWTIRPALRGCCVSPRRRFRGRKAIVQRQDPGHHLGWSRTDNLPPGCGDRRSRVPDNRKAYGRDPPIRLGQETTRLNFVGEFGDGSGVSRGSRPRWERLQERLAQSLTPPSAEALIDAPLAEPFHGRARADARHRTVTAAPPLTQAQVNERDPALEEKTPSDARAFHGQPCRASEDRVPGKAWTGPGNERAIGVGDASAGRD